MNSKKIDTIFTDTGTLSRKDIDTYRETSDEKVKQVIEKKSLASDFDADALDGWASSNTGISSMEQLDAKFKGNSISLRKKIIGSFTLLLLVILAISIFNHKTTTTATAKNAAKQKNKIFTYEKTDIILPSEIVTMNELPLKEQIQIKTIQKDFKIQKDEMEDVKQDKKEIQIEKLTIEKIDESNIESEIVRNQSLGKEVYLVDMKLIDYRNYRSRPAIKTKTISLEGIPASQEGRNSGEEDVSSWKIVEIPYMEYLEKTMISFSKGNNKKALSRFEIILESYPTDLNANFYGGLCYFNLGEFDKAIKRLEICFTSEFNNFNEEVEWYLAKSYAANGQNEKASALFKKIITAGGYYAKQAEKY